MVTPPAGDRPPLPTGAVDLDAVLTRVLEERQADVSAWLRDEPGSWGRLAGQGVLAARRALGRGLADAERRVVWQRLWDRLMELKSEADGDAAPGA